MKKKNDKNEVVTKVYLDKTLDRRFKEVDKKFKDIEKRIDLKLAIQTADLREEMNKQSEDLKSSWTKIMDKFYQRINPLLIEIETASEDRTITTNDIGELKITTKNHEKRLQKLEKN